MDIVIPAPTVFEDELVIPEKTLFGPGPANYPERVQNALCNPVLGHLHPETLKIMDDIKEGFKYLFQTENPVTLCVSAAGHGAMETAFCNLIEDGDVVLIGTAGIWGKRAADMARRYGGDVRIMNFEPGKIITLSKTREFMQIHRPKIFFIAHGESSTGVLQPLEGFGELCREYNCLLVVDTVITLGAVPFYADKWKIDVVYSGTQKVLNAPPGISPISFNERALNKVYKRISKVKVYYFDIVLLGEYWNCFPGRPRIYHHTVSCTLLYGLREALAILIEEGLEESIQKHAMVTEYFQNEISKLGLEFFVENPVYRCPTVTSVKVPVGVKWTNVSNYAMQNHKVEISGGLGPTANKIFRFGLMGQNATTEKVDFLIKIFKESLENSLTGKM